MSIELDPGNVGDSTPPPVAPVDNAPAPAPAPAPVPDEPSAPAPEDPMVWMPYVPQPYGGGNGLTDEGSNVPFTGPPPQTDQPPPIDEFKNAQRYQQVIAGLADPWHSAPVDQSPEAKVPTPSMSWDDFRAKYPNMPAPPVAPMYGQIPEFADAIKRSMPAIPPDVLANNPQLARAVAAAYSAALATRVTPEEYDAWTAGKLAGAFGSLNTPAAVDAMTQTIRDALGKVQAPFQWFGENIADPLMGGAGLTLQALAAQPLTLQTFADSPGGAVVGAILRVAGGKDVAGLPPNTTYQSLVWAANRRAQLMKDAGNPQDPISQARIDGQVAGEVWRGIAPNPTASLDEQSRIAATSPVGLAEPFAGSKGAVDMLNPAWLALGPLAKGAGIAARLAPFGEHAAPLIESYIANAGMPGMDRVLGAAFSAGLRTAKVGTGALRDMFNDLPSHLEGAMGNANPGAGVFGSREPVPVTAGARGKRPPSGSGESDLTKPNSNPGILSNVTDRAPSITSPGQTHEFTYKLVDANDLILSHHPNGVANAAYPAGVQPRARERVASQAQVDNIARNLDPNLMLSGGQIDRGTPIVGPGSNVVESGNGRGAALIKSITDYADKYGGYRSELERRASEFGFTPEMVKGMQHPVLVRERVGTTADSPKFAAEANNRTSLDMSPSEKAIQDAGRVHDRILSSLSIGEGQSIDQALLSSENAHLRSAILGGIPETERASLADAQGNLNRDGLERLKAALFAKTFPGPEGQQLLNRFRESIDPGMKNIEAALFRSLPSVAKAEGLVRGGQRSADMALGQDLAAAVNELERIKATPGANVATEVAQLRSPALFAGAQHVTPAQTHLIEILDRLSNKPKQLTDFLRKYAELVDEHGAQGTLMGGVATRDELIDQALAHASPKEAQMGLGLEGGDAGQATSVGAKITLGGRAAPVEQTADQRFDKLIAEGKVETMSPKDLVEMTGQASPWVTPDGRIVHVPGEEHAIPFDLAYPENAAKIGEKGETEWQTAERVGGLMRIGAYAEKGHQKQLFIDVNPSTVSEAQIATARRFAGEAKRDPSATFMWGIGKGGDDPGLVRGTGPAEFLAALEKVKAKGAAPVEGLGLVSADYTGKHIASKGNQIMRGKDRIDTLSSPEEAAFVAKYIDEHGGSYAKAERNAAKAAWKERPTASPEDFRSPGLPKPPVGDPAALTDEVVISGSRFFPGDVPTVEANPDSVYAGQKYNELAPTVEQEQQGRFEAVMNLEESMADLKGKKLEKAQEQLDALQEEYDGTWQEFTNAFGEDATRHLQDRVEGNAEGVVGGDGSESTFGGEAKHPAPKAKGKKAAKAEQPTDFNKVTHDLQAEVASRDAGAPSYIHDPQALSKLSYEELNALGRAHLNEDIEAAGYRGEDGNHVRNVEEGNRYGLAPVDQVAMAQVKKFPELWKAIRDRHAEVYRKTPTVEVPAEHLTTTTENFETKPVGAIAKAQLHYDEKAGIKAGKDTQPVEINGKRYVGVGGTTTGRDGILEMNMYEIVPRSEWTGPTHTYQERSGMWGTSVPRGDKEGIVVKVRGTEYVMLGRDHEIRVRRAGFKGQNMETGDLEFDNAAEQAAQNAPPPPASNLTVGEIPTKSGTKYSVKDAEQNIVSQHATRAEAEAAIKEKVSPTSPTHSVRFVKGKNGTTTYDLVNMATNDVVSHHTTLAEANAAEAATRVPQKAGATASTAAAAPKVTLGTPSEAKAAAKAAPAAVTKALSPEDAAKDALADAMVDHQRIGVALSALPQERTSGMSHQVLASQVRKFLAGPTAKSITGEVLAQTDGIREALGVALKAARLPSNRTNRTALADALIEREKAAIAAAKEAGATQARATEALSRKPTTEERAVSGGLTSSPFQNVDIGKIVEDHLKPAGFPSLQAFTKALREGGDVSGVVDGVRELFELGHKERGLIKEGYTEEAAKAVIARDRERLAKSLNVEKAGAAPKVEAPPIGAEAPKVNQGINAPPPSSRVLAARESAPPEVTGPLSPEAQAAKQELEAAEDAYSKKYMTEGVTFDEASRNRDTFEIRRLRQRADRLATTPATEAPPVGANVEAANVPPDVHEDVPPPPNVEGPARDIAAGIQKAAPADAYANLAQQMRDAGATENEIKGLLGKNYVPPRRGAAAPPPPPPRDTAAGAPPGDEGPRPNTAPPVGHELVHEDIEPNRIVQAIDLAKSNALSDPFAAIGRHTVQYAVGHPGSWLDTVATFMRAVKGIGRDDAGAWQSLAAIKYDKAIRETEDFRWLEEHGMNFWDAKGSHPSEHNDQWNSAMGERFPWIRVGHQDYATAVNSIMLNIGTDYRRALEKAGMLTDESARTMTDLINHSVGSSHVPAGEDFRLAQRALEQMIAMRTARENGLAFDSLTRTYRDMSGRQLSTTQLASQGANKKERLSMNVLAGAEAAMKVIRRVLVSPRYTVSRFQTVGDTLRGLSTMVPGATSMEIGPLHAVSRESAKALQMHAVDMAKWYGTWLGLAQVLSMAGLADTSMDPRSSDFGSIRLKNGIRFDPFEGTLGTARLVAQSTFGQVDKNGKMIVPGQPGYLTPEERMADYLTHRLSPVAGVLSDMAMHQSFGYKGFDIPSEALNLVTPGIAPRDIVQAVRDGLSVGDTLWIAAFNTAGLNASKTGIKRQNPIGPAEIGGAAVGATREGLKHFGISFPESGPSKTGPGTGVQGWQ